MSKDQDLCQFLDKEPTTKQIYTILGSTLQWIFPDKYSKTIGLSVRGFEFTFPNLTDSLKNLLESSSGLINKETGTEETSSVPTEALFFSEQNAIEDAIKISKNIPVVCYINENYFLYDKNDLIKETFITALNKKYQFMVQSATLTKKTKN